MDGLEARRGEAANVVVDGRIYVSGGIDCSTCGISSYEVYDPATDTWSTAAPLPLPRSRAEWATFVYGGEIYSVGGVDSAYGSGRGQDEVFVYDPGADAWRLHGHLVHANVSPGAKAVGETLYVFGGGHEGWFPVTRETWSTGLGTATPLQDPGPGGQPEGGQPEGAATGPGVYPNPARGAFTVDHPASGHLAVFDALGRRVARYEVGASATRLAPPPGRYLVRFTGPGGVTATRAVTVTE